MTAVYASLALTSFVAEITTWAKMSSAFLWLKIALVMRLLYAIFQSYLATKAARGPSTNSDFVKQEITSATVNIFLISVLYFYFRFSSRVQEIFGRNISRSEKIRPRCESPSPAPSTASIHNSSNEKI
jgi:hypothetical protein